MRRSDLAELTSLASTSWSIWSRQVKWCRGNAPAPTIRKSVLLKNTASLALLRFFAAQGGEPAPASRFRSGT